MKIYRNISLILVLVFFTGSAEFHKKALRPHEKIIHLTSFSTDSSKYLYQGMEKCASVCHNNKDMGFQFDIIRKSPHSNSYNVLFTEKAARYAERAKIKGDASDNTKCLSCHVTGAGLDSSFFSATYRKEDGVTCEACHKGPYITKTFIPTEEDCLKCHGNSLHKMRKFNYKEDCARIAHKRPVS